MTRNRARLGTLIAGSMLVLFTVLAIVYPRTQQYPYVQVEVPGGLTLATLLDGQVTAGHCAYAVDNLVSAVLSICPQCQVVKQVCVARLSPEQLELLSEKPIKKFSTRMPTGVTVFQSENPELARLTCEESERRTLTSRWAVKCIPPETARPHSQAWMSGSVGPSNVMGLGLLLIALMASSFVCWIIVRFQHLHGHFSHDQVDGGPQKFHVVPTPRVGGVAVMAGMMAVGAVILILQPWYRINAGDYGLLLVASLPAFLGGLVEDVTKRVGVLDRLFLTMASGALAAWLMGATLDRVDMPGLDQAMVWLPFAILFTAFAVGGMANAINIIDGYNGIAAGYAAIALASFAWVSAASGDVLVFKISLTLMGALLGFLLWNWPRGRIFLGDGGAYLLGFLVAEISVLLLVRNPEISPWYPLLLMIYPVFETLFSVYRRTFSRGRSPGHPDALHLHQLIYSRLVRLRAGGLTTGQMRVRNNRVAAYCWATAIVLAAMGSVYRNETEILMTIAALFVLGYVWLYRRIAKWKAPRWMIRTY